MSIGDLVRITEVAHSIGFDEVYREASMLVVDVLRTLPGYDTAMAPVVEVVGPNGLSRFSLDDLKVLSEIN